MTTPPAQAGSQAAARGTVLVLILLMLALFSVVAALWVVQASLHQADAMVYCSTVAVRAAADSALEHAKAALVFNTQPPSRTDSGWVTLSSNAVEQVQYRVTLLDNAAAPADELRWPAMTARRASPIVPCDGGWRRIADPYTASHSILRTACQAALQQHDYEGAQAGALALALADAYDDNLALAARQDAADGYEGVELEAARPGDNRVVPIAHVLRQSYFYDLEYQRDNFAIFGAFAIERVEPVVTSGGHTNTRVRLQTRLTHPARQRQWEEFQSLWRQAFPARFIPHAWRGRQALIVTECGGASATLTLDDNDDEWLYFSGYPLDACVAGRYVSINLCSVRAEPGSLTPAGRGVRDVWFVTGLLTQAEYTLRIYGDGLEHEPDTTLVLGEDVSSPHRAGGLRVRSAGGVVGVDAVLESGAKISAVHMWQPEWLAWRNTGVQPLHISGWQWQRCMPERLVDALIAESNAHYTAQRAYERAASPLVAPGGLWWWTTGDQPPPAGAAAVTFALPFEAGHACVVGSCDIVPSPYGGWAWRIAARVHPDFRWTPGIWRGAVLVRACDSNAPARSAYTIIDNSHAALTVHAGTRAIAEEYQPREGTWVRVGGMLDAARRGESALVNALGQTCARVARTGGRPAPGVWHQYDNGFWRAGALPEARRAPAAAVADTSAARIAASPAWRHAVPAARDAAALADTLNTFVSPHGIDLPVSAAPVPHGWMSTSMPLRRSGARTWRMPRTAAPWPDDFWRGAEIVFHTTGERVRVVSSSGASLHADRPVRAASGSRADVTPIAGAAFHVAAQAPAEGAWTWRIPEDACTPLALYVRGFCPPGTGTAARMSIAVWNMRASAYQELAAGVVFDQHDVVRAGALGPEHLDAQRRVRLRVTTAGAPVWLRGLYAIPAARSGRTRAELAGWCSDGFSAHVTARVVRGGRVVAEQTGAALLVRTWQGPARRVSPMMACEHLLWQTP